MKKRILALLLCFCLLTAAAPAAYAYTPEEERDLVFELIDFLNNTALEGHVDDQPLYGPLKDLFEAYPGSYELLMDRLLSQYDAHTMYIPAGAYDTAFPESNSYVGVGVTIQEDPRGALVTGLNTQGPAYMAGVKVGDVITAVDGAALTGKPLADASALLRGAKDTWATLTVDRAGKALTFTVLRIAIGDANFSGYLLEEGVYYMKWTRISTTESFVQFIFALQDLCEKGARALILDLRGNPGGALNLGFSVVDRLLPDAVDYFKVGQRDGEGMVYETMTSTGQGPRLNQIVVLSDYGSASASEIIQCGLVDTGYAVSVGTTTYGKARAQYHLELDDQSAIVVTIYQLLSLTQGDYEEKGLEPNYLVANEYGPAYAASCAPVPERALPWGNCSDNAEALNAALKALGYLGRQERPYFFSQDTQLALMRLCYDNGLTPSSSGMTVEMARLVNRCLEARAASGYDVLDWQMEKALELCREAAKQPAQYHLDELGNLVNDPKK